MSGASSFRNAVKRITHKERDQPSDRKKFGHLEKHVDYKVRSKDYKNKRKYISNLKKKASERNPDEFYFQMHNSKVENNLHKDLISSNTSLDVDTVQLLKTQDISYLNLKRSIELKKIEKAKENLHFIDMSNNQKNKKNNRKVFFENEIEREDYIKEKGEKKGSEKEISAAVAAVTVNDREHSFIVSEKSIGKNNIQSIERSISSQYKQIHRRIKRIQKVDRVIQKLSLQRNLMGKGTKRKVTDKNSDQTVYKWKRQRAK